MHTGRFCRSHSGRQRTVGFRNRQTYRNVDFMSSEQPPVNPRFAEDLQMRRVAGPARYNRTTDGPVTHLAVADRTGTVIGYLWANDKDVAAGWVVPAGLSANAVNAGGPWLRALRDGKARDLAPTDLLAELVRGAKDSEYSHAVRGSLAEDPSLAALRERVHAE